MARPVKERAVQDPPRAAGFRPVASPGGGRTPVILSLDEYEAIRLVDHEGLDHAGASEVMGISRPTFTRLIERARSRTAAMLVEARPLRIEGGNIHFCRNRYRCRECGEVARSDVCDEGPKRCARCGSDHLDDMARHFGHGGCCRRIHQERGECG